jgi:hypothetical protein
MAYARCLSAVISIDMPTSRTAACRVAPLLKLPFQDTFGPILLFICPGKAESRCRTYSAVAPNRLGKASGQEDEEDESQSHGLHLSHPCLDFPFEHRNLMLVETVLLDLSNMPMRKQAVAVLAISSLYMYSTVLRTPCSINTCLVYGPRFVIAAEISGDIA